MKIVVLQEFRDKDNFSKIYEEDGVYDLDKDYAEHLARLGLVEMDDSPFFKSKNFFDEELSLEELKTIAFEMGYTLEPIKTTGEVKSQEPLIGQVDATSTQISIKTEPTNSVVTQETELEDLKKEKKSGK